MKISEAELAGRINRTIEANTQAEGKGAAEPERFFDSVRVSLSEGARARSMSEQADKAIDESDLPGDVKTILKMIRELKEKLAEALLRLRETMSDDTLTPDERRVLLESIQLEVSTLQSALTKANASLIDAMKLHGLSDLQISEALQLLQL
ncbi:hypothetical protein WG219_11690 [Ectopseudomonas mendocina]|uniref:Uncharacterized protein n=1 Tax=Ectopseudomonas mendocina TaxID=300 RepID=A0ABZ2RAS6_ECTME